MQLPRHVPTDPGRGVGRPIYELARYEAAKRDTGDYYLQRLVRVRLAVEGREGFWVRYDHGYKRLYDAKELVGVIAEIKSSWVRCNL
jgi:hypothetical protein